MRTACWLCALVMLLASTPLWSGQAQEVTSTSKQQHHQASLPVLYSLFLRYQNHLDRVAADLESRGNDGSEFRDHFKKRLQFTDADYAQVRATAQRLDSELQEKDAQAAKIIADARKGHPRIVHSVSEIPSIPPELSALQAERNALIEREVSDLKAKLGEERSSRLDQVVQNEFAPNVKIQAVKPPPTIDRLHLPQTFHPAVQ